MDQGASVPPFDDWLRKVSPHLSWDWEYLKLIRFYLRLVDQREIERLMIFIPPQFGKTEQVTIHHQAYYLEMHPGHNTILASYSQTQANKYSRRIRAIARGRIALSRDRRAVTEWETAQGGGLKAVGVNAGVTGNRADAIYVDDPIKGRKEAESAEQRNSTWDWYNDELITRLVPGGPVYMILCMTGDTPVLMADGTEKHLSAVQPGDRVATYDAGRVSVSTVTNWKNQGPDLVYEMRTKSGITVKANERHPFLVKGQDGEKWVALKDLRAGDQLIGVNGGAFNVQRKDAANLPSAKDSVLSTITGAGGVQESGHRLTLMKTQSAEASLSISTGSHQRNTIPWSLDREAVVQYANSPQSRTREQDGAGSCALITTTKQARSGECSVTTVISSSETGGRQRYLPGPLSTYKITLDEITDITPVGYEDVFDIEVQGTENFIANGLVSHNTRWHEDDLAGRILNSPEGKRYTVLSLPAIATRDEQPVYDDDGRLVYQGRKQGQSLNPLRYPVYRLEQFRERNERTFQSLYQQMPGKPEGNVWKRSWFNYWAKRPSVFEDLIMSIDPAFDGDDNGSYVVIQVWGLMQGRLYLLDQDRRHMDYVETEEAILAMSRKWPLCHTKLIEKAANGHALLSSLYQKGIPGLVPVTVAGKGSKEYRARAAARIIKAGTVYLPSPELPGYTWVRDVYLDEITKFPSSANNDQVDATSQLLHWLYADQITMADNELVEAIHSWDGQ